MNKKKISQYPLANALTGAELIEVVQSGVNKKSTIQAIDDFTSSQGAKIYVAYVVPQAGGDPIITEVVNTLGGIPSWVKITETQFNAILNGVFLMGKTMATVTYITTNMGGNWPVNNDDRTVIFESAVPFMAKIEVF